MSNEDEVVRDCIEEKRHLDMMVMMNNIDHTLKCIYKELSRKSLDDMLADGSIRPRTMGCIKCDTKVISEYDINILRYFRDN